MQTPAENYKSLFFRHLKPFLDMLEFQHTTMDAREWGATVYRIASGVENHPEQYLGKDLPSHEVTTQFIREIFEDFIQLHQLVADEALFV
ncbi:MAG TPA: hypothetical protein VK589_10695 [Chryseolinea sp.]|nr:hypothetical protein [Chryseolinea sp.]